MHTLLEEVCAYVISMGMTLSCKSKHLDFTCYNSQAQNKTKKRYNMVMHKLFSIYTVFFSVSSTSSLSMLERQILAI